ncbi:hypothetical protein G6F31_015359 [Rhizopus arrhizus]|nr:hypothetical protein G6F31_015359 [Rhizopus arrhizus]
MAARLTVGEGLYLTTSRDILEAMARGEGPANAVVTLGCAGWGAGQLESELAENSWLTVPADAELVFQLPLEQRWQGAASRIGVDLFRLTDYSGHCLRRPCTRSGRGRCARQWAGLGGDRTPAQGMEARWPGGRRPADPGRPGPPNRKRAQGFARQLRERFKLPVVMIDERSSSVEAARRFAVERAKGRKRRRDAAALDAVAAAVIIDRWLSSPDDATPIP